MSTNRTIVNDSTTGINVYEDLPASFANTPKYATGALVYISNTPYACGITTQGVEVQIVPPIVDTIIGQAVPMFKESGGQPLVAGEAEYDLTGTNLFTFGGFVRLQINGTGPQWIKLELKINGSPSALGFTNTAYVSHVYPTTVNFPVYSSPTSSGDKFTIYITNLSSADDVLVFFGSALIGGYNYMSL